MKTKKGNLLLFALVTLCMGAFTSCSNDDEIQRISLTELSMTTNSGYRLEYNGKAKWKSDNPIIAEVDQDGWIESKIVGTTYIYANKERCKVTVVPRYNYFKVPNIQWGTSKEDIDKYMYGYRWVDEQPNYTKFLGKRGEIVNEYIYKFENGGLVESVVTINAEYSEEVFESVNERYPYNIPTTIENLKKYVNVTQDLLVSITTDEEGNLTIRYTPYTGSPL